MRGQKEVRGSLRAPRDPAAWNRPCLLCTSCTCSFSDCAGRCSPLRTPCTCSLSERAGRCSPLRTPCTCSFAERAGRCSTLRTPCTGSFSSCAHIAPAFPLVLASPHRCSLPRLHLALPAFCCPVHSAPPQPCCCLHHPSAPTGLPCVQNRFFPRRFAPCPFLLDHCPRASCPCRCHQPHQLPHSWPHRRPHPLSRPLPTQAPCPFPCRCCRCPHLLVPHVLRAPHLPRPRHRRHRVPRPPPAPHALSAQPPPQHLPPLLSDQSSRSARQTRNSHP